MKTRKFNPLAAFGVVIPPHEGAVHYQDGGYFGPGGDLLFEDHPATPPKEVVVETTVVDSATGESTTTTTTEQVEVVEPGDPKTILTLWLKGEADVNFQTVRGLVKKGFGVALGTKDEVLTYLVGTANLVPAELVKVK